MEQSVFAYENKFVHNLPISLTFNDVLLVPQYSEVESRSQCDVNSRFSKNIPLKIPVVTSPMDTVTEHKMAIEMARLGGLGIIHRFMSIEDQAEQVQRVKRAQQYMVTDPIRISKNTTYGQIKKMREQYGYSTFLVVDEQHQTNPEKSILLQSPKKKQSIDINQDTIDENLGVLLGILTNRDIKNFSSDDELAEKWMTPRSQIHAKLIDPNNLDNIESKIDPVSILNEMKKHKIEKIPVVIKDTDNLIGLITAKDMEFALNSKYANKDDEGKYYVGAAVGANKDYIERSQKLVDAGVNVLVVDVANGHSTICIKAVQELKKLFPEVDIVAGSVATGEGALKLIEAGADGIRCGIGNGSICITRIVAGAGVPQLTALMDVAPVCKHFNIPLISDGGNKCSGNMAKALAAGADCVMVGRLVAGCEESPSAKIFRDGKLQKVYRGMAGFGANFAKALRTGEKAPETEKFNPEGVEGYTPYSGPLEGVVNQFVQGIKSGMSYSGAFNIKEHQKKSKFLRITSSGFRESNVHGVNKVQ